MSGTSLQAVAVGSAGDVKTVEQIERIFGADIVQDLSGGCDRQGAKPSDEVLIGHEESTQRYQ